MSRTDLLRAKSTHTQVAYLRELRRIGEAKRDESSCRLRLKEKELSFWAETLRAQDRLHDPSSVAGLDRLQKAHSQLGVAQHLYRSSAERLRDGLVQLSNTKKRADALQCMISKADRLRSNKAESRIADGLAELSSLFRPIDPDKKGISREVSEFDAGWELSLNAETDLSLPQVRYGIDRCNIAGAVEGGGAGLNSLRQTGSIDCQSAALPVRACEVRNISVIRVCNGVGLTITCALVGKGNVSLSIIKEGDGGLKLMISSPNQALTNHIQNARATLNSRLSAVGLKVADIQIKSAEFDTTAYQNSYRKKRKEDDEDYLA